MITLVPDLLLNPKPPENGELGLDLEDVTPAVNAIVPVD
jgi:hypothetical protein